MGFYMSDIGLALLLLTLDKKSSNYFKQYFKASKFSILVLLNIKFGFNEVLPSCTVVNPILISKFSIPPAKLNKSLLI